MSVFSTQSVRFLLFFVSICRFFHPILTYVVVAIITMWIILYREYVHDTKEGEVPSCDDQTSIFAAMYHGKGEVLYTHQSDYSH